MSTSAAVEVGLGLVFMYFVFSTLCSGINEAISRVLNRRGTDLFKTINALIGDSTTVDKFWKHPLVHGLTKSRNRAATVASATIPVEPRRKGMSAWLDEVRSLKWAPSYITPATFATVIRDIAGVKGDMVAVRRWVKSAAGKGDVPALLVPIADAAGDDIDRFQSALEAWYRDTMDRLSGSYKRWTKKVLLVIAALVVIGFNINTLRVAEVLWREPTRRAAVVQQVQGATPPADGGTTFAEATRESANLPIGWSSSTKHGNPLWVLAGWALSVGAVSLGAPFWFDLLGRLGSLRSTGPPPKEKD